MVRKSLISWVVPELVSRRMMCMPFFGGTTAGWGQGPSLSSWCRRMESFDLLASICWILSPTSSVSSLTVKGELQTSSPGGKPGCLAAEPPNTQLSAMAKTRARTNNPHPLQSWCLASQAPPDWWAHWAQGLTWNQPILLADVACSWASLVQRPPGATSSSLDLLLPTALWGALTPAGSLHLLSPGAYMGLAIASTGYQETKTYKHLSLEMATHIWILPQNIFSKPTCLTWENYLAKAAAEQRHANALDKLWAPAL